jgi:hypothetical protein
MASSVCVSVLPTPGGPCADSTSGLLGCRIDRWWHTASSSWRSARSWPTIWAPRKEETLSHAPAWKCVVAAREAMGACWACSGVLGRARRRGGRRGSVQPAAWYHAPTSHRDDHRDQRADRGEGRREGGDHRVGRWRARGRAQSRWPARSIAAGCREWACARDMARWRDGARGAGSVTSAGPGGNLLHRLPSLGDWQSAGRRAKTVRRPCA